MKKSITKKIINIILIIAIAVLALSALLASVIVNAGSKFDESKLNISQSNIVFLDKDDNDISHLLNGNNVLPSQLNSFTKNAFVSIEDKRFYSHNGIDIARIFGAVLANIKSGKFSQGASTISQQLIKNTHLSNDKTIKRKINEALLSIQLENKYTKDEILCMYLNNIYFGNGAKGIKNASQLYFNKQVEDLTIGESALLAATIKAPSVYAPSENTEKSLKRRNLIINTMYDNNFISSTEKNEAFKEEVKNKLYTINSANNLTYINTCLDEVSQIFNTTIQQVLQKNIIVSTYLDEAVQNNANKILDASNTKLLNGQTANKLIILSNNKTSGIEAIAGNIGNANIKRQIGSTAKPVAVYLPLLDRNEILPLTVVDDSPIDINGYKPKNSGKYLGKTTIRQSVAKSSNVVPVQLINNLTPSVSVEYLKKQGIDVSDKDANLSLALGSSSSGINLLQLLQSYQTIANNGQLRKLTTIRKMELNGKNIFQHSPVGSRVFNGESTSLMTDMLLDVCKTGTASELSDVAYQIAGKTGTVGIDGTKNNSDALFVGYTTEHSFLSWIGDSNASHLSSNINGATTPILNIKKVLNNLYSKNKPNDFDLSPFIEKIGIDIVRFQNENRIEIANNTIPNEEKVYEYFKKSNSPHIISNRYDSDKPPEIKYELKMNTLSISYEHERNCNYKLVVNSNGKMKEISMISTNLGEYELNLDYNTDYYIRVLRYNIISKNEFQSEEMHYYLSNSNAKVEDNSNNETNWRDIIDRWFTFGG